MKALTLLQPWASLVAMGVKEFETRSWWTSHRGELAICASASTPRKVFQDACRGSSIIRDALGLEGYDQGEGGIALPSGAVLCTVDVEDCYEMSPDLCDEASARVRETGVWAPGRYAWKLVNVRRLVYPIPVKGFQRLWTLPEKVACAVRGSSFVSA